MKMLRIIVLPSLLLTVLPVDEIAVHYLGQTVVRETHHQFDVANHVVFRHVFPHLNAIQSLPHFCLYDKQQPEPAVQPLFSGLVSLEQRKGTHIVLGITTVQGLQICQPFVLPRLMHACQVLLYSSRSHFRKQRYWLSSKTSMGELLLLVDSHIEVILIGLRLQRASLGFEIARLDNLLTRVEFGLKLAEFKLLLYPLKSSQVFAVSKDLVQAIQLVVAIGLVPIEAELRGADNQFAISFSNRSNNSEKCQLFPLLVTKKFTVELYELEEDAFQKRFGLLSTPLQIQKSDQRVEDESGGSEVVSEVDEFEHPPCIDDGRRLLSHAQECFMQASPFLERVIAFLFLVLVFEYHEFEFVLLDALHSARVILFVWS